MFPERLGTFEFEEGQVQGAGRVEAMHSVYANGWRGKDECGAAPKARMPASRDQGGARLLHGRLRVRRMRSRGQPRGVGLARVRLVWADAVGGMSAYLSVEIAAGIYKC